jgi:hypothetical protein
MCCFPNPSQLWVAKACIATLVVVIVLWSVIIDVKFVDKHALTAEVAPLARIDIGSPIFINILISILSGVVILVTGAPYVEVLNTDHHNSGALLK